MKSKWFIGFSISLIGLGMITGCGSKPTPVSNVVIKKTPQNVSDKLIPVKEREMYVKDLPTKVDAENVVYLSPFEGFAIQQYAAVWPKLKPEPAVVWVGCDQVIAEKAWKTEGFSVDPLPSQKIFYDPQFLATPVAYHKTKDMWLELPGILNDQANKTWIAFFN
ncbi:hypothetical protein FY534_14035 (plasmid) [Alicyclobacillus sp. TC]|uniref:Lipoprotein n=1 Tax=Alicyclobacillus tolerans TaxID=90970 RepID=A0ABT9M060_9BACL|nr:MULTISPECIES: hypothetical protein [Alicyclobacillus]MDP9729887.1 hypothetical protein [Alicyclobacillus tengchongensis]QRF24892.1 hypothetical protein FY534_14035 [Alicyclobacillus sp. TC]